MANRLTAAVRWIVLSTGLVYGAPPTVVSLEPSSGAGMEQVFTVRLSDPDGNGANIRNVFLLIRTETDKPSFRDPNACSIQYRAWASGQASELSLLTDSGIEPVFGSAWLGPVRLGARGTVGNSQCTVDAGRSSESVSGQYLTLTFAVAFKPAFVGMRIVYVQAIRTQLGGDIGMQRVGWWEVKEAVPPPTPPPPTPTPTPTPTPSPSECPQWLALALRRETTVCPPVGTCASWFETTEAVSAGPVLVFRDGLLLELGVHYEEVRKSGRAIVKFAAPVGPSTRIALVYSRPYPVAGNRVVCPSP